MPLPALCLSDTRAHAPAFSLVFYSASLSGGSLSLYPLKDTKEGEKQMCLVQKYLTEIKDWQDNHMRSTSGPLTAAST